MVTTPCNDCGSTETAQNLEGRCWNRAMCEERCATEFSRRRGLADTTHRDSGKRYFTVSLRRNGRDLGSMTQYLMRGKVTRTEYHLPTVEA